MHKYKKHFIIFCIIFFIFILYQMNNKTTTTMKYFPIDETEFIKEAETSLSYNLEQRNIEWKVHSSSSLPVYLRQDVSLLYENGVFKGLQSKWEENGSTLTLGEKFPPTQHAFLQSISLHHGEIHHDESTITSIQKMTHAKLYIIQEGSEFNVLSEPKTPTERQLIKELSSQTTQQLQLHWNTLIDHYQLSLKDYDVIPLDKIVTYNDHPLPGQTIISTTSIIGQFWEGLYNNYLTLLMSYKKDIPTHYMPVILFAKDQTHLLVLFEIDNEKHKLIQQISTESISSLQNGHDATIYG